MGTISKNFSYREFEASATADRQGICNVIRSTEVRDAIKHLVIALLQPLRDIVGHELRINSGYRCEALNKALDGSSTSQHVKGEAADIHTGSEAATLSLAKEVIKAGLPFDQMILYPTFLHLSLRLQGNQRKQVLYNYRYHGEKLN